MRKMGGEGFLEEGIDVGVICGYKGEVEYLGEVVRKDGFLKGYGWLIRVNRVEGFEGEEGDVIVMSVVGGNEEGEIGLVNELGGMKVGMRGGGMKVIIVGDGGRLRKDGFYKKV